MRQTVIFLCLIFLTGCAEKIESIIDDPGTLLKDPGFAGYQQRLDELESRYLRKEMTYAEYLEKKKAIEDNYEQEVKKQEESLKNPEYFKEPHEALR